MTDLVATRWERFDETARRWLADGELAAAEQAFIAAIREAEHLGPHDPRLAASLGKLGQLYCRRRELAGAEALFGRSLAIYEARREPEPHGLVQSINNLAALYCSRGEFDRAEPLFRRVLAIREKASPQNPRAVAAALEGLAEVCAAQGKHDAVHALRERALEIRGRGSCAGRPVAAEPALTPRLTGGAAPWTDFIPATHGDGRSSERRSRPRWTGVACAATNPHIRGGAGRVSRLAQPGEGWLGIAAALVVAALSAWAAGTRLADSSQPPPQHVAPAQVTAAVASHPLDSARSHVDSSGHAVNVSPPTFRSP